MRYIGRILACGVLACLVALSVDADGAKRRRTTTGGQSVTEATREAAINASKKKNSNSPLMQITVDKPDLDQIREATLDPGNKFYFPKLMDKYEHNDTVMTPEEYRYLYLGYMFQEDYDPYRMSPYAQKTDSILQLLYTLPTDEKKLSLEQSRLKKQYIKEIRENAEKALKDNPFDLRQMSHLVHVMKDYRKNMTAKIWEYRLEHLLAAIKSTGTGEDEDNAWFVIYPMHEYDIIQLLGYEATDMEYIDPGIDRLIVRPDGSVKLNNPAKSFYFNVLVPQQQYMLKYDMEEETT